MGTGAATAPRRELRKRLGGHRLELRELVALVHTAVAVVGSRASCPIRYGLLGDAAGLLAEPRHVLRDDRIGCRRSQLDVAGPAAREQAAMAALGGTLFLFGGQRRGPGAGPDNILSDTWTFDGTSWTELHVPGPPARVAAAMAPLQGKLVLFGGDDYVTNDLADTWTWGGESWTKLDIAGPVGRWDSPMATLGDTLVLFGGLGGPEGKVLDDTWTFDGAAWTELPIAGPSKRAGTAFAAPAP